jgi:hypothetical protein
MLACRRGCTPDTPTMAPRCCDDRLMRLEAWQACTDAGAEGVSQVCTVRPRAHCTPNPWIFTARILGCASQSARRVQPSPALWAASFPAWQALRLFRHTPTPSIGRRPSHLPPPAAAPAVAAGAAAVSAAARQPLAPPRRAGARRVRAGEAPPRAALKGRKCVAFAVPGSSCACCILPASRGALGWVEPLPRTHGSLSFLPPAPPPTVPGGRTPDGPPRPPGRLRQRFHPRVRPRRHHRHRGWRRRRSRDAKGRAPGALPSQQGR